jgi:hypothetical protein
MTSWIVLPERFRPLKKSYHIPEKGSLWGQLMYVPSLPTTQVDSAVDYSFNYNNRIMAHLVPYLY